MKVIMFPPLLNHQTKQIYPVRPIQLHPSPKRKNSTFPFFYAFYLSGNAEQVRVDVTTQSFCNRVVGTAARPAFVPLYMMCVRETGRERERSKQIVHRKQGSGRDTERARMKTRGKAYDRTRAQHELSVATATYLHP